MTANTNTNTTAAAARRFYAESLRQRRIGEGCFPVCPKAVDYKRWALRALALAGPRGRLP